MKDMKVGPFGWVRIPAPARHQMMQSQATRVPMTAPSNSGFMPFMLFMVDSSSSGFERGGEALQ